MQNTYIQIRRFAPLVFWAFQLIIHIIRNLYRILDNPFTIIFESIRISFPLDIITFSVFYYFFAPKFFKKKHTIYYAILSVAFFILHSLLWTYVYKIDGTETRYLSIIYISSMGHNLLYAFYGIMIRMAIDWFQKRDEKKELEKQNVKIELALLRSQINPHFLFNTLNNINSFTQSSPDKTSYAIIKLSGIMRYMLYEAKEDKVLIEKEINYIKDYLDLQRLRYKDSRFIQFGVQDIPSGLFIPPMLFIPFIENAFKHGRKGNDEKISFDLGYKNEELIFICFNKKRILNDTEKIFHGGIGIKNIKRRLQLIYPSKHQLLIEENDEDYKVNLKIILS